jgi:formylglycine-generating enzyme required for sulfatase activity
MTQPTAKPDNHLRGIRGGTWIDGDASEVRSSARYDNAPARRYGYVGFRTALTGRTPR